MHLRLMLAEVNAHARCVVVETVTTVELMIEVKSEGCGAG